MCIDGCIIEDSACELRFTCILLGKVDVAEHPFKRYKVIKTHHELSGRRFLSALTLGCDVGGGGETGRHKDLNASALKGPPANMTPYSIFKGEFKLVLIFKNRNMSLEEMTHWENTQNETTARSFFLWLDKSA